MTFTLNYLKRKVFSDGNVQRVGREWVHTNMLGQRMHEHRMLGHRMLGHRMHGHRMHEHRMHRQEQQQRQKLLQEHAFQR